MGGHTVLRLDEQGPALDGADLLRVAFEAAAGVVACPAGRLDPAFFDLRSGVAGEVLQRFVNYGVVLAVIGPLPAPALTSRAFAALVREANRGTQHWFLPDMGALRARLGDGE